MMIMMLPQKDICNMIIRVCPMVIMMITMITMIMMFLHKDICNMVIRMVI